MSKNANMNKKSIKNDKRPSIKKDSEMDKHSKSKITEENIKKIFSRPISDPNCPTAFSLDQ